MRRTTAAVIGTLAGTALLTGLKLGTGGGAGAMTGDNAAAGQGGDLGQAPAPATKSQQPAGTAHHKKKKKAGHTGAGHGNGNGQANASGLKDGTFLGKSVAEPYGRIRVAITVSSGKITVVRASYPTGGESSQVNGHAIPILKRETLTAQNAHVDSVSGATYTSPAFRESLQSALNTAHA